MAKGTSTNRRIRLEMDCILFDERHQPLCHTKKWKKSALVSWFQERSSSEWKSGILKVWYDRKNNFWNQCEFTSRTELETQLSALTEYQLVKDFL